MFFLSFMQKIPFANGKVLHRNVEKRSSVRFTTSPCKCVCLHWLAQN